MAAMTDPTQRLAAALRACARRVPTRLHLTAAERRTLCVAAAAGAAFAVAYRGTAAALDAIKRRAAADDDGDDASSASGDEAGARLSLVYDVAVGDRVVADVPHKTVRVGDRASYRRGGGGSGVVVGLAPGDGEVWVSDGRRRFKAQAKHLAHAPLAGGLAKGDQVVACAGFERVEVGDPGAVVGPCSSPNLDAFESRVLVDFGAKGRYSYTRAQLAFADLEATFAKEDRVVATAAVGARVAPGDRGVVKGADALRGGLVVDFGDTRAALAHAPLVPGHDVRKNDVIRAKVDYEDVRAGDLGVVLGPCDRAMPGRDLRVCVLWRRTRAKNNWQPGKHVELAAPR
ncbi:serine/threonine kinase [Aureococcus anophagefferens]|nr:serine/threonine kinase [Aureococcus anophagefferens]